MEREQITVRIEKPGANGRGIEVRANGEDGVWLRLLNPDGDGEVLVEREVLEDALAYVTGGGPGEWEVDG